MKINKKYLPIYISSGLLVIMIVALTILIFTGKENIYIPKTPANTKVDIGITSNKFGSIRNIPKTSLNSKFYNFDNLYKKEFTFDIPATQMINNKILAYNQLSEKPYLLTINLDGKKEFLTKISIPKYKELEIIKFGYMDGYYAIAYGIKNNNKDLVTVEINEKGDFKKLNVIEKKVEYVVKDVFFENSKIIMVTEEKDIMIKVISGDKIESTYKLDDDKNDVFLLSNPIYKASYYKDGFGYLFLKADNYDIDSLDHCAFLYKIDLVKNVSSVIKIKELYDVQNDLIVFKNENIYRLGGTYIKIFDLNGKYLKEENSKSLELENADEYSQYLDGETPSDNHAYIDSLLTGTDDVIFRYKTQYSDIFDKYENNQLKKRYVVNRVKTKYQGISLNTYIVNDKIYDIYSYGYDRPSVLVNIIG